MKTILIVDDMPAISEPISLALSNSGFKTVQACNGAQGLQELARSKPDLILLDLIMPVMDGISFLRIVRGQPATRGIPVIVLSGQSDKSQIIAAIKLGISGFILKSKFSLAELRHQVNKCLGPTLDSKPAKVEAAVVNRDHSDHTHHEPKAPVQVVPRTNDAPAVSVDGIRSLKPITTRDELTKLIDGCEELKGFSPAISEVLKLTGTDRCSIEQIAKAISRDHAIALKVLKLANSAVYTRGEPIDSVQKAVMRIGVQPIRQAVLNIAVIERFNDNIVDGFIESGQFWEHAVATGIIAAEIAHTRSDKEADGAFTMGLLHDVGRIVMANQLGEMYVQVLKAARDLQLPLDQVEHRMLFFNHADIMDRVLRRWSFPKEFINPIVFHHLAAGNIRNTAPQEAVQIATLGLANRLAHAFMLGSSGNQTISATEELCEMLRLEPKHVARIESIARDETDKIKLALLTNSNQSNWSQLARVHQASLSTPLHALYVSASPGIDAHRIFCDQLSQRNEAPSPNLGVIYVRHVRERAALTEQFLQLEAQTGVGILPLLVISPNGNIMPETAVANGRRMEALTTPFGVDRFIASVNRLVEEVPARAAA